jgi:hypothetical protein
MQHAAEIRDGLVNLMPTTCMLKLHLHAGAVKSDGLCTLVHSLNSDCWMSSAGWNSLQTIQAKERISAKPKVTQANTEQVQPSQGSSNMPRLTVSMEGPQTCTRQLLLRGPCNRRCGNSQSCYLHTAATAMRCCRRSPAEYLSKRDLGAGALVRMGRPCWPC